MSYLAVPSTTPPGAGQSKALLSADLFDPATGTYPLASKPSVMHYAKDGSNQIPYYGSSSLSGATATLTLSLTITGGYYHGEPIGGTTWPLVLGDTSTEKYMVIVTTPGTTPTWNGDFTAPTITLTGPTTRVVSIAPADLNNLLPGNVATVVIHDLPVGDYNIAVAGQFQGEKYVHATDITTIWSEDITGSGSKNLTADGSLSISLTGEVGTGSY